jgi:hypothetical protein
MRSKLDAGAEFFAESMRINIHRETNTLGR